MIDIPTKQKQWTNTMNLNNKKILLNILPNPLKNYHSYTTKGAHLIHRQIIELTKKDKTQSK